MTKSREEHLSSAYSTLHTELSGVLYNEDPDGMDVTAGAPDDEYSAEVSKLIPRLQGVRDREAVAGVVRQMFPTAGESLVDRVFDAWTRFIRKIE